MSHESTNESTETQSLSVEMLKISTFMERLSSNILRIANKIDPPPPDIVDSGYVAQRIGCTTTWIADQARAGDIPRHCIVPGTGGGKPWKFHRSRIEAWISSR